MSPALWSLEEAAAAMGAAPRGTSEAPIHGVSIDTRRLAPGDLFFAIKGENRDGHDFVDQAMEKGATAVVSIAKSFAMPLDASPSRRRGPFRGLAPPRPRRAGAHEGTARRGHRLGRQDRHQGGAAPGARRAGEDARARRLLQQPLGRAAHLGAHAARRRLRRRRDRHERTGRDQAAHRHGASARGARHHGRAGASRILPVGRRDRRRQGRDFLQVSSRAAPRSSISTMRNQKG